MTFHILTIFPQMFDSYLKESIIGRAQKNKKIKIKIYDIRKFSKDKHKKVDDRPYAGGPGMVMTPDPIVRAIEKILSNSASYKVSRNKKKALNPSERVGQVKIF